MKIKKLTDKEANDIIAKHEHKMKNNFYAMLLVNNKTSMKYLCKELKVTEEEMMDLFNGDVFVNFPEMMEISKLMQNMMIDMQDTDLATAIKIVLKYYERVKAGNDAHAKKVGLRYVTLIQEDVDSLKKGDAIEAEAVIEKLLKQVESIDAEHKS